jgi:hypothetical protein
MSIREAHIVYRSHTGKTKAGETFEKFLGKKEYDESLLVLFERFLQSSFCKYHSKRVTVRMTNLRSLQLPRIVLHVAL